MRRLVLVLACVCGLSLATEAAGIAVAFRGTDGAATGNGLSIKAGTNLANINAGFIFAWVKPDNVNNTARNVVAKNLVGPGGWELFKRAVDGTSLSFTRYRAAGTNMTIVSPTGVLKANVPTFLALTWDTATTANHKMYAGTLDTPAALLASTNTLGSGTAPASDAAQPIIIGNNGTSAAGWPGVVWAFGIAARTDYSLDEIRRLQYTVRPSMLRGCAGLWIFNSTPTVDLCGAGNHGALIGTGRMATDALPRVQWLRPGL